MKSGLAGMFLKDETAGHTKLSDCVLVELIPRQRASRIEFEHLAFVGALKRSA